MSLRGGFINLVLRRQLKYSTVVTADELLRRPILERSNTDPDTLQDLDGFPVPLLPLQLREALRKEFGRPIQTRTDWSDSPLHVQNPVDAEAELRGDFWRASRLVHETLAVWRNRSESPLLQGPTGEVGKVHRPSRGFENHPDAFVSAAVQWIQGECDRLYEEIINGTTERFESSTHLVPEYLSLTQDQQRLLQPALIAVSRAPKLHPAIKNEIMQHILQVVKMSSNS